MKFNVSGKALADQLTAVSRVINAKSTMPILENFLLHVDGDKLFITGSDSENIMTATLDILESDGEGDVAISAKRLLDIAKEVAGQPITFELDNETMNVKLSYLTGEFNFPALDGSEYPQKKEPEEEPVRFSLPADIIRKGIENTLFAVSLEQIRPIMTGIFFDVMDMQITFVSSDTHKLVRYINHEAAPGVTTGFILPSKPAGIIKNLINAETAPIEIVADSKTVTFTFDSYVISSRLIKGVYPAYNRVIPSENPFRVRVNREALLTATRRVSIGSNQAAGLVKFAIDATQIRISSQDLDYALSSKETVDCQYEGNPMTIGFKADYTKEVLSNLKGDEISIELSDPARPGLFMPAEQEEMASLVMLQMPMQVFE